MRAFAVLVAALLLVGEAVAAEQERALEVGGRQRTYVRVTPDRQSGALPLLIVYHGGTGNPEQTLRYTRFDRLAASGEAVVVFPAGVDNNWNDGRQSTDLRERAASKNDDVAFTIAIIEQLVSAGLVDRSHVFLTGASNGGMMSLRTACEAADHITGIAPVIASLPVDWDCAPSKAMPAMFFNGTEDEFIPFKGGRIAERKTRRDLGVVRSVDETMEIFRRINGCSGVAKSETLDRSEKDETKAIVTDYECSKAPLRQVLIEGGGHTWPGARSGPIAGMILGRSTPEIDATKEIWDFFKALPPR
jgi:polyhydroxybutyrate depolymerase